MNALKMKYNKYLDIVGFPCNQFGLQEPGADYSEIMNGLKYARPGNNFVPNFPLTKKLDVNGKNQDSLFYFLKQCCPQTRDEFSWKEYFFYDPFHVRDIKWNFEKFLIYPFFGIPYKRYDSTYSPKELEIDIEYLINYFIIPLENKATYMLHNESIKQN